MRSNDSLPATTRPPGPAGDRWVGNLLAFEDDPLGFLVRSRDDFGAVVSFDRRTTIVHDLDLALQVLGDPANAILGNYRAARVSAEEATAVLGRRPALNPGLRPNAVTGLGPRVAQAVRDELAEHAGRETVTVDLLATLQRALSRTTTEHYVGPDWPAVHDGVGRLLDALDGTIGNPFALPAWFPAPSRLRIAHRDRQVGATVQRLVDERRNRSGAAEDGLTALVRHPAVATSSSRQVADLVIGSLLAAHRIPAAGATWALLELAARPDLQEQVAAASTTPGSPVTAVALEAMRLHPPTWILHRTTTRRTQVGRYRFDPGHQLVVSPYAVHRDPWLFRDALRFDPARWADHRTMRGFLAFGHGMHRCPGQHAGLLAVVTATQEVLRRWHVVPSTGGPAVEAPGSTLAPQDPRVLLVARTPTG